MRVRCAGERVPLVEDPKRGRFDLVTLGQFYRAFVDADEGNAAAVRRPPVTLVTVHLFLGDELRQAVRYRIAAVVSQLEFLPAVQRHREQVLVADKAEVFAVRREANVGLEGVGRGELFHGVEVYVVDVQVPAQREQHAFGVRVPEVLDNARVNDALSLAFRFLLVGQVPGGQL